MKNELKKKTIKSLFSMLFSSSSIFALQFVTTLVLARIFTPEHFGIVSAVTIISGYTDILWQAGIGPAIVQKNDLKNIDIRTGFSTSIAFGFIAFIIIFFMSPILVRVINIDDPFILQVVAISFIINSLAVVPLSLLQREMKFNTIIKKDISSTIIYAVVAIFLGLVGFGVWALVIALISRYLVSTVIVLIASPAKLKFGFKLDSFKRLIHFGTGHTLSSIFNTTAMQGDYFVITQTLGTYSLGIYNRAFQLITVPARLVGQVIDQVFFPAMSRIQDDNKRLSNIFILATTALSIIYLPLSMFFFVFAEELILILLGTGWVDAAIPFKILCLSIFFRVGYKISDPIFRSKGKVYNRAFIQAIYAAMIIGFSFIGSLWGLVGISVGVSVALLINYIILVIKTYKLIRFDINHFLKGILPLGVLAVSIALIMEHLKKTIYLIFSNQFTGFFVVLIALSLIAITIVSIVYIFILPNTVTKQYWNIIQNIRKNKVTGIRTRSEVSKEEA